MDAIFNSPENLSSCSCINSAVVRLLFSVYTLFLVLSYLNASQMSHCFSLLVFLVWLVHKMMYSGHTAHTPDLSAQYVFSKI